MRLASWFIALLTATVLLAQSEAFETASVKLLSGQDGPASFHADGTDRFTATNTPLELLIEMAFGVDDTHIYCVTEQLWLRLEPRKVPVEILVIDYLEKVPTDN